MPKQAKSGAVLYARDIAQVSAFYAQLCGMQMAHLAEDHIVLESPVFQLVVVAIQDAIAAAITVATPPVRREGTPIKLAFPVDSIEVTRDAAIRLGGALNPVEREWRFQDCRVCDGHDPEGNVVQFKESAGQMSDQRGT